MDIFKMLKSGEIPQKLEKQLQTLNYLTELLEILNKNMEDLNTSMIQFLLVLNTDKTKKPQKKKVKKYKGIK